MAEAISKLLKNNEITTSTTIVGARNDSDFFNNLYYSLPTGFKISDDT